MVFLLFLVAAAAQKSPLGKTVATPDEIPAELPISRGEPVAEVKEPTNLAEVPVVPDEEELEMEQEDPPPAPEAVPVTRAAEVEAEPTMAVTNYTAQRGNAVDCQVGPWTSTAECSEKCGGGIQARTRMVEVPAAFGGAACPATNEEVECNTQSCRMTVLRTGVAISWPMPRPSVGLATDGDISTWTYTTAAWCEHTQFFVGISLPKHMLISGIRLHKRFQAGPRKDCGSKTITVIYGSEMPGTPPPQRGFSVVKNLVNGYDGNERWNATDVEPTGTIRGETHDSLHDGWASMAFSTVNASLVALQVEASDPHYNHFCLGEMELFQDPDAATLTRELRAEL